MQENTRHIQHEVAYTRTIQIPLIKRVTHTTIESMVDFHVRRGEVPRYIAVKLAKHVFKEIADGVSNPLPIQIVVVTLVRESVVCVR